MGLATAAAVAVLPSIAFVPAAHADSHSVEAASAAHGHGLWLDVAGLNLLGTASALSEFGTTDPGESNSGNLDPALLGLDLGSALGLGDGVSLPLVGTPGTALLDLGDLATLISSATSESVTAALGASGVAGDGPGGVSLDPNAHAGFDPATLDVSALLAQVLGDTAATTILDTAALEIGALGATAVKSGGDEDLDYMLAGAQLRLQSPLVAGISTQLDDTLDDVGALLNAAVSPTGVLGTAVANLPNLTVGLPGVVDVLTADLSGGTIGITGLNEALADTSAAILATTLVDPNNIVQINLNNGEILVDLSKVVAGGSLNGLPANTPLINGTTLATIATAINQALGTLSTHAVTAVEAMINNLGVQINLNAQLQALCVPLVGCGVDAGANIGVTASLGQLTGAVAGAPTLTLEITSGGLIGTILDLLGLSNVDQLIEAITTPLLSALTGALAPVVGTLLDVISDGDEDTGVLGLGASLSVVTTSVFTALQPVLELLNNVLRVTINEQPSVGDLGEDSATVRALSVSLLPATSLVTLQLGSASVQALDEEPDPVAITSPVNAAELNTGDLPVSGTGEAGAGVTVELDNGTDTPATATTTVTEARTWSVNFPAVEVGAYTITATQDIDGSTDSVTITVVAGETDTDADMDADTDTDADTDADADATDADATDSDTDATDADATDADADADATDADATDADATDADAADADATDADATDADATDADATDADAADSDSDVADADATDADATDADATDADATDADVTDADATDADSTDADATDADAADADADASDSDATDADATDGDAADADADAADADATDADATDADATDADATDADAADSDSDVADADATDADATDADATDADVTDADATDADSTDADATDADAADADATDGDAADADADTDATDADADADSADADATDAADADADAADSDTDAADSDATDADATDADADAADADATDADADAADADAADADATDADGADADAAADDTDGTDEGDIEGVVITSPADGSVHETGDLIVTGTGEAGATVVVTLIEGEASPELLQLFAVGDPVDSATTTVNAEGEWTVTFADVAAGAYGIEAVQFIDEEAHSNDSVSVTFVTETTEPTAVSITEPADGATITEGDIRVVGIGDPGANVTVQLQDEAGATVAEIPVRPEASGDWEVTFTGVEPGEYTIIADQVALDGTTSTDSVAVTVIAATAGPTPVDITTPNDGDIVPEGNLPVEGTGEPGATVTVELVGDDGEVVDTQTTTVDGEGNWSVEFENVVPGGYDVIATQNADGVISSQSVSFRVSPLPTDRLPETGSAWTLSVTGIAVLMLLTGAGLIAVRRREGATRS